MQLLVLLRQLVVLVVLLERLAAPGQQRRRRRAAPGGPADVGTSNLETSQSKVKSKVSNEARADQRSA